MKVLHVSRILPQEMLGPMVLARMARQAGHDMQALFLPDPLWLEKFKKFEPDVVTWSVMTGNHKPILALNRFLKTKFDFFSVMGGPHPTFVPDVAKDPAVDAICIGEGEHAFVELLDRLERGEDWHDVRNLAYHDGNGHVVRNPLRPLVKDLDSLGFPDRSLVYDAAPIYRDSDRKVFLTQRGCPMSCSFCFHHAWRGKVYGVNKSEYVRKRSVDHVLAEVEDVRRRWPLRFVHFLDDIFNIRTDWLEEFCDRWPREVGLPFDVILMANMTTRDHIQMLKKAGCVYARIAVESANDHIRNTIYRKNTERRHLENAAAYIKEAGIRLGSLNMLGAPGGTLEDEFETIRLNQQMGVDHPLCSIVQPYPEFDLNEITREMGYAVAEYDDFPAQFNRESSIELKDKTAIENLHKWFPILVRHPRLEPLARFTLHKRWLKFPLTAMYALYSEWLVTEQNVLYRRAQGVRGLAVFKPFDYALRVTKKVFIRAVGFLGAKWVQRMATRLQMGDERVVAHID